jgi:hypothetical protein
MQTTDVTQQTASPMDSPSAPLGSLARVPGPLTDALSVPLPDLADAYCFTLGADLEQRFAGEIPGGCRLDVEYFGAQPSVWQEDGASGLGREASAAVQAGELVSGSDWMFVSAAGIAAFDSRITLALGPRFADGQRCLIEGRMRGRADLRDLVLPDGQRAFPRDASNAAVLNAWMSGLPGGCTLPLVLAVLFDVPIKGYTREQTELYDQCRELERASLLGIGEARLGGAAYSPLTAFALRLHKLPPVVRGSK